MHETVREILSSNKRSISSMSSSAAKLEHCLFSDILAQTPHNDLSEAVEIYRHIFGDDLFTDSFAEFCRAAAAGITVPDTILSLLPDVTTSSEPDDHRIAYLRNAYTDRAFSLFSAKLGPLSAQYQPSFTASCEEVYAGRCSACILPLYHSEDGFLHSFNRMIIKYDLKIVLCCDIPSTDDEATLRYVLLRRNMHIHVPQKGLFQVFITLPEDIPVGVFLNHCEKTGAGIVAIHSLPYSHDRRRICLHVCFHITPDSLAPLLLFLQYSLSHYSPDGIFENIS